MENRFVIIAFYKFASLDDYHQLREELLAFCKERGILGTILLASEGINATISGSREAIDSCIAFLNNDPRLAGFEYKESYAEVQPFVKMKVRLKREIVALGVEGIDPNTKVGTYVKPEEWNALISDPEVIVIDTRNFFEVELGTFANALNPKTTAFRQFPRFVKEQLLDRNKKIAMFCTGGIRCEKASSYMLEQGFTEVYHLQGGILKYLEEVSKEESLFKGECFVFDERITVNHDLAPGSETSFERPPYVELTK